jgi:hypothetical protein
LACYQVDDSDLDDPPCCATKLLLEAAHLLQVSALAALGTKSVRREKGRAFEEKGKGKRIHKTNFLCAWPL